MEHTQKIPLFLETAPYQIPWEFYRDGFGVFQKKYFLRRNRVMMLIFAVLLVSFVAAAVSDPTNQTAYFLIMLCLAALCMLWYNPRKQRRMVLDAAKELSEEQYTASCDGKVLRIHIQQADAETEQIPESRILLETAWVQEQEQFYLICDGKRMFYVLPKAALDAPPESEQILESAPADPLEQLEQTAEDTLEQDAAALDQLDGGKTLDCST